MAYRVRTLLTIALCFVSLLLLQRGTVDGQADINQGSFNTFSIDFENLTDRTPVTNQYANLGLSIEGATVVSQGGSLNHLAFPPRSGINVVYDDSSHIPSGTITVHFNSAITGDVYRAGGYVTGNRNIVMSAYSSNGALIGSVQTGGANHDPVGIPNMLLDVSTSTPIAKLVFFNGGERGNTYTIDDLFFESQQLCEIADVPLYKQQAGEWAQDDYGGTTINPWKDPETGENAKLGKWGCALTSAAMVVSYHGVQQNGFTTTPRELNNWLRNPANGGYSGGHLLWGKVAEYARNVGGIELYYYEGRGPGHGVVNTFLCNGDPIVLSTNSHPYTGGHFLLATGQSGEQSWFVNDPGGHNLTQRTTNQYNGYRKFSPSPTDPSGLMITVHSPVELLITDPAGRRTGYDPIAGEYLNEILDATYGVELIGAVDGSSKSETLVFATGTPMSGEYSIQVIGTGNGIYRMNFLAYESNGGSSFTSVHGAVFDGLTLDFTATYSNEPDSQINVEQLTTLPTIYLPAIRK
jgi:hypothetical protein